MNHTDGKTKTNCNWVSKDYQKTGLPFHHTNSSNSVQRSSIHHIERSICDDCFIESTKQYKNLYIQIATCYAQRMNKGQHCSKLSEDYALAHRILIIGTRKIAEIEKHREANRDEKILCKETVKAIGELTSQFIDLFLRYSRTDDLLDLFNEALNRILRSNNDKESSSSTPIMDQKPNQKPDQKPDHKQKPKSTKCILEDWQAVSKSSAESSDSSQDENGRQILHLTDWYGHQKQPNLIRTNSRNSSWVWSERSKT